MKRIALYVGALPASRDQWQLQEWCIHSLIGPLLAGRPDDSFLLLFAGPTPAGLFDAYDNVACRSLGPVPNRLLPLYRRFNYKLPAVLRQSGCQLLLSMTGVLPLKKRQAVCLLLPDGIVIPQPGVPKEGQGRYQRRFLSRFLNQTDQLVTLSDFSREQLMSGYQMAEHRITVVARGPVDGFQALGWEERQAVKDQYTSGKEYLLYPGDITRGGNVIGLLKAFSILKKKMRSGMVLVLAGSLDPAFKKFPALLDSYHFRKDVVLTGTVSVKVLARLMGGAYGCVFGDGQVGFSTWVPEALKCRTPLVVPEQSVHATAAGAAALCFDPADVQQMGEQLCKLYKDEELRARLIAAADEQLLQFSWAGAARSLEAALFCAEERTTKK